MASSKKAHHVVCLPASLQGHINPMMKLAKLLNSRGFYITMILNEFGLAQLAATTKTTTTLGDHDGFAFEAIPDGLPPHNKRGLTDLPELSLTVRGDDTKNALKGVLIRLLANSPHNSISALITDVTMFFGVGVAKELGIPVMSFCTTSACGMLGYLQYDELINRGLFPLKDESCLTNGFLDTPIDWVSGLSEGTTLKHLPSFLRTTNANDTMFDFLTQVARNSPAAEGLIFNTFYELEADVLKEIKTKIPNLYTIGPLSHLCKQASERELLPLCSSLWEEDTSCIEWLDKRSPKSVIYVNYGSLAILTPNQLEEFAWGLANTKHSFLWVLRPGLVEEGFDITINKKYRDEIKERGLISSWCSQEKVLQHPSIAVFFTHCGWNSTLESMIEGVPMICWPFFAEQPTNCMYACQEWRIGVEMEMEMEEGGVRREKVEGVVREMMEGGKGEELRGKAMEWKLKAAEATGLGGSSHNDFEKLVKYLM